MTLLFHQGVDIITVRHLADGPEITNYLIIIIITKCNRRGCVRPTDTGGELSITCTAEFSTPEFVTPIAVCTTVQS